MDTEKKQAFFDFLTTAFVVDQPVKLDTPIQPCYDGFDETAGGGVGAGRTISIDISGTTTLPSGSTSEILVYKINATNNSFGTPLAYTKRFQPGKVFLDISAALHGVTSTTMCNEFAILFNAVYDPAVGSARESLYIKFFRICGSCPTPTTATTTIAATSMKAYKMEELPPKSKKK